MIRGRIIHPAILGSLAAAGHRSTVLISDAHYAASTAIGPNAVLVYLNLEAGIPTVPHVVQLLGESIVIEKRTIMDSIDPGSRIVQTELDAILGPKVLHETICREDFYAMARSENLGLCIVTGDVRRFGNVLLTVGVNTEAMWQFGNVGIDGGLVRDRDHI